MSLDLQYWQSLILYQDTKIAIINKPIGVAVQGGTKIEISIDEIYKTTNGFKFNAHLVHRLDKDTSGLLILAKNQKAAKNLCKMLESRVGISKKYLAIIVGQIKPNKGKITIPLINLIKRGREITGTTSRHNKNAKEAETLYSTMDKTGDIASLLELIAVTGRKHQLRAHLHKMGSPILGDGKYGGKAAFIASCNNKIHLHAVEIIISNYLGENKPLRIIAPIPPHFKESLDNLELSCNP
jgi:23S rRNA pseudouridine955/2504/2580 synthase